MQFEKMKMMKIMDHKEQAYSSVEFAKYLNSK